MFEELPKKGLVLLTYIFNAIIRLRYVPSAWKEAQVIMIPKPGKPTDLTSSYRPISLLPVASKLFEKLLLKRLKPVCEREKLIPDFQYGFRNKHSTIDQVHRITSLIQKALEEKKFCVGIFLDVAQAFDKVWHKGLMFKLQKILSRVFCEILKSYLSNRKFRIQQDQTTTDWYQIRAGVPQGSILGPILFLLYTADIPMDNSSTADMFADDTAILATDDTEVTATAKIQQAVDAVNKWAAQWKIKFNSSKSAKVTFSLRSKVLLAVTVNGKLIPQLDSVKYLGTHLDSKLNWSIKVKMKRQQMRDRMRNLYWLVGRKSTLSLENKRLLYVSIIKPIWTYGIQLWGCASNSNVEVI